MRIKQDLCIALVLAVVGVGFGKPAISRNPAEKSLATLEDAMAGSGLTEAQADSVRRLIAAAQERERAGDEDGAVSAMTEASVILGIV